MNILSRVWFCLFVISTVLLPNSRVLADDTCIFSNADIVKPNIVILLDNGAEMEQINWHSGYNNTVNYAVAGSIFTNPGGYVVDNQATGKFYLNPINADLTIGSSSTLYTSNTFTINNRTITLPFAPSTVNVDGVIDKASRFRYSTNYLNWLFYGPYTGDGTDLPTKSRFYYAKQAIFEVALQMDNRAYVGVYNFTSTHKGASSVQPLKLVGGGDSLDSAFVNNINNMGTVSYSPLAEGLATLADYFNSPSSETVKAAVEYRCQDSFALLITAGVSSKDLDNPSKRIPSPFSDYDKDGRDGVQSLIIDNVLYQIPQNVEGSTWLDDVAYYMANNDMVRYHEGFQPVNTYTVGVMTTEPSRRFLINTSNNGNNHTNLTDSSHPEYGKYHFDATSPKALTKALMDAINAIFLRTSSFTAPVVPVTRTTSGDKIYLSFFKPSSGNFWQGNVAKFGLNADNEIVDKDGKPATWPNGSFKEGALPYWATIDWADTTKANGVLAAARNIFTYLGGAGGGLTAFNATNITAALLGNPTKPYTDIINYVRGEDVLDEDNDGNSTENREFITGDVLHSEPLVYEYVYPDASTRTMVYFGANDGMLHAVNDEDGTEAWGFIPPHQLPRLKGMVEGTKHLYFVDATPKIYHNDLNKNKVIDAGEQVILVSGERKGSNGYFALDVTAPDEPKYLWRISGTSESYTTFIPELAESWSNPVFGRVKTTDTDTVGTPVLFIGAGYDSSNSAGKAILVIDVRDGSVVKMFKNDVTTTGMDFSIASEVRILDINGNGFIDKAYVGDMGGQMWRLGKFTAADGTTPLPFPASDENVNNWTAKRIFAAGDSSVGVPRRFFYPPSITLERGYHLVHSGTGDREDPCNPNTSDLVFTIKDGHDSEPILILLTPASPLLNVTDPTASGYKIPDLDGVVDAGWYYYLDRGEKMLAEGIVLNKVFYFTTFTPSDDPCVPGGIAKLYALNYKTGAAVSGFLTGGIPGITIGGGIPSRPVLVLSGTTGVPKLLISVGSTMPDGVSQSEGAGIPDSDLPPKRDFKYIWWKELFD